MSSQEEKHFDAVAKDILVKLVTSLLVDKPKDPVTIEIDINVSLGTLYLFLST